MVTTILFENPSSAVFLIPVSVFLLEYIKMSILQINISEIDIFNILIFKTLYIFFEFKKTILDSLFTVLKVFPVYYDQYKTKPFILPDVNIHQEFTVFISIIRKITHDFSGSIIHRFFFVTAIRNGEGCY